MIATISQEGKKEICVIIIYMKKVLCFGDSNTFGFNPADGSRFSEDIRWTGRLKKFFADRVEITEAGGNNRTAFSDNPQGDIFTGYKAVQPYLSSRYDIIILAAGINDLQKFYNVSLEDFKNGLERFVRFVKANAQESKILLLAPSKLKKCILNGYFGQLFDEISIEKSLKLDEIYKEIAQECGCEILNLNDVAETSDIDGLHYTKEQHREIFCAVMKYLLKFL